MNATRTTDDVAWENWKIFLSRKQVEPNLKRFNAFA
jgi:hypothetical protein